MRMSGEGLLQTLFYQIVSRNGGLIPEVLQDCRRNYELLGGNLLDKWHWPDLVKAFKSLISDQQRKFFFFIDSLDDSLEITPTSWASS